MRFTNELHVPRDPATTLATLTDLEKVAPCLPGATLDEVDGDVHRGSVRVKVGPVALTYRGEARLVETDAEQGLVRIEAKGKEARGAGTATAEVVAHLEEAPDGTRVMVETDLAITGRPAQLGSGVLADVGTRIVDTFAERLRALLDAEPDADPSTPEPADAEAAPPGGGDTDAPPEGGETDAPPEGGETDAPPGGGETDAPPGGGETDAPPGGGETDAPPGGGDALDLLEVAGPVVLKRLAPLVAAAATVAAVLWWWRRR